MIRVTCAILIKEGRILLARRSERMAHPLKWEFPGGKLEEGEGEAEGIRREIREELGWEVEVTGRQPSVIYAYPDKTIELIPMLCRIAGGEFALREHKAIAWTLPAQALEFDLAPADVSVLKQYLASL